MAEEIMPNMYQASRIDSQSLQLAKALAGEAFEIPENFFETGKIMERDYELFYKIKTKNGAIGVRATNPGWRNSTVYYELMFVPMESENYQQIMNGITGLYHSGRLERAIDFNKEDGKPKIMDLSGAAFGYWLINRPLEGGLSDENISNTAVDLLLKNAGTFIDFGGITDNYCAILAKSFGLITDSDQADYYLKKEFYDSDLGGSLFIRVIKEIQKNGKTYRIAAINSYPSDLYLTAMPSDTALYNYLDSGRIGCAIDERGDGSKIWCFLQDPAKDKLLVTSNDLVLTAKKAQRELYWRMVDPELRDYVKMPEFCGSDLHGILEARVENQDLFGGFQSYRFRKISESAPTSLLQDIVGGLETRKKLAPSIRITLLSINDFERKCQQFYFEEIDHQIQIGGAHLAEQTKTGRLKKGEKVIIAGGVSLENGVIDLGNVKLWMECKEFMRSQTSGKLTAYRKMSLPELLRHDDMNKANYGFDDAVAAIKECVFASLDPKSNSVSYHPLSAGSTYTLVNNTKLKEREFFRIHINDIVMEVAFKRTEKDSSLLYINGRRVGRENFQQLLSRMVCFSKQEEYDALVENISKIPFAAHDLLNEGFITSGAYGTSYTLKFNAKREKDGSWFIKAEKGLDDGKTEEVWIPAKGGFRSILAIRSENNLINLVGGIQNKIGCSPEEAALLFEYGMKENIAAEKRAKKLLEDVAAKFPGRVRLEKDGKDGAFVQGTSGNFYHVGMEANLPVNLVIAEKGTTIDNLSASTTYGKKETWSYVCIVDTQTQLNKIDRFASRIMALADDIETSKVISTLAPHVKGARKNVP